MKGGSEHHLMGRVFRLERWENYHLISAKDLSRLHQFGWYTPWICAARGENLEG